PCSPFHEAGGAKLVGRCGDPRVIAVRPSDSQRSALLGSAWGSGVAGPPVDLYTLNALRHLKYAVRLPSKRRAVRKGRPSVGNAQDGALGGIAAIRWSAIWRVTSS